MNGSKAVYPRLARAPRPRKEARLLLEEGDAARLIADTNLERLFGGRDFCSGLREIPSGVSCTAS
jgi:hypothetical protein